MSSSGSSQVAEPKANPCFNYQAPIPNNTGRKDGYLILPNFNTFTGPVNQKLAIMKNSECPELLKVSGHTSKGEDEAAYCHEMFFNQPYYVASGPKDKDPVFTAQFFGENNVKNIRPAYEAMKEACEIAHRKSADPNSRNDISEFEQRSYVQGFTITQQQKAICAAPVNAAIIENTESTGRLNQLAAIAAGNLLANCAPKEVLNRLAKQAESAVPITFGHEDNKFFSTVQYNYFSVEIESLEMSLGNFGALHIDGNDDSALWTVLLVLSNIPESYCPGRIFVSSLRIYATMGRMTALVFKTVHPHISLGPIPMGESKRLPYAYLPENTHIMDPVRYNQSRLVAMCYPKGTVMRETPALIRRSMPRILQTIKGVRSSLPEAHPIAIAAFGILRNQMEFLARLEAHDKVKMHRINPFLKMPTADLFVQLWSWEENGATMTPRVSRIQAVLDGDGETEEWYKGYSKKCNAILSMRWFDGNKKTEINWVSTENIGSTFAHLDPLASTAAKPLEEFNKWAKKTSNLPAIKRSYGKLPTYVSAYTYEWQMPQPSVDPTHQERNSEFEEEGEEQLAEEGGLEDEEFSEEEGSVAKKRKRESVKRS